MPNAKFIFLFFIYLLSQSILSVDDVSGMKLEITKRIMAGPLYSVETGGSYHLGQDPEQAEKEGMAEFTASVGSQVCCEVLW